MIEDPVGRTQGLLGPSCFRNLQPKVLVVLGLPAWPGCRDAQQCENPSSGNEKQGKRLI